MFFSPFVLYIFLCRLLAFFHLYFFNFFLSSFSFPTVFTSLSHFSFLPLFLSFSQSCFCFSSSVFVLFLAAFFSGCLPYHFLFLYLFLWHILHVLHGLSQECSLLGMFQETRQRYIKYNSEYSRRSFSLLCFPFKLRVEEFQFVSGSFFTSFRLFCMTEDLFCYWLLSVCPLLGL